MRLMKFKYQSQNSGSVSGIFAVPSHSENPSLEFVRDCLFKVSFEIPALPFSF